MALPQERLNSDTTVKFLLLTKKLLSVTQGRSCEKQLLTSYLNEINELDYKSPITFDSNATLLLINQLCSVVQPSELQLVKSTSQFMVNLVRCGERFYGRTFVACQRWILECLKFADVTSHIDLLLALQSLLRTGPFDIVNSDLRNLLGKDGVLLKFIAGTSELEELRFLAVSCLEAILLNREESTVKVSAEFLHVIQNIVLDMVVSVSYDTQNKHCYNKTAVTCLRILRSIAVDKGIAKDSDAIGKVLGVVQSFMLHGVRGYLPLKAHHLRPAAMNLPETAHTIPRGRNLRSHKLKSRRQQPKKDTTEVPSNGFPQGKGFTGRYPSDSDASDTEAPNPAQIESKVRLEALQLLNSVVQNTPSRETFGYWPQLVASGSGADARVLAKCILREPTSKVRQVALCTLTELLVGAKLFLMHAEDADRSSFVSFFGTVSAMIGELHSSLSLLLSTERNIAVLTHALKCSAALAQGTPYSRLKPGLATKLIRNCRLHIRHKDPTVRVAALSVFEAIANSDPITPEMIEIFSKQSNSDTDTELSSLNLNVPSDVGTDNEFQSEDIGDYEEEDYRPDETLPEKGISSLLYTCLNNVSNEDVSVPVRLGSVKVIGALAFNVSSVVLPHLEIVAIALVSAALESEMPVALHAGRVIETIAGCVANSPSSHIDGPAFWNIAFDPVAKLAQSSQTNLREVACDCLGNLGSRMISLLPRERSITIITILFGAARDEESAVRAASLRALGMLVELPSLEDDVGFLMDLADVVCLALDDQNPGVRVKAAWTLANLCDCLVRQKGNEDVEPIPVKDLLPRLYQAGVKASKDHDKVKCNAVRAIGSTLYLCPDKQTLKDTTQGLDALINCATTGNDMKVRWNSCRALGFVLSHEPDGILPSVWREQVFPALCCLVCHSPNFKVRTNAAWALSVCHSYGKHISALWRSVVLALENSQHMPSYVEYSHRDALVQQLCLTLSHLAVRTAATDLPGLWEDIRDHIEDTSVLMKQFQERVLPEKAGDIIKAKEQMIKHAQCALTSQERQIAVALTQLFERSDCYDNLDIGSTMD